MPRTRMQNARKNISGAMLNRVVALLSTFVTRTVIISLMGTMYAGLSSLFSAVLQILSLAELGFGSAMVFSMYKPIAQGNTDEVNALLNLYKRIYRIIGLAVLAIGLAFIPALPVMIRDEVPPDINLYALYLINLANTVLSYSLFAYRSSILSADQRSHISSLMEAAATMISNLAQILIIVLTRNFYLFFLVLPVITACRNICTHVVTRRLYPQYCCRGQVPPETVLNIKKRVAGLFVYKVCQIFRHSFDSIIISAWLGLKVLTQYGNYYYIMSAVSEMTGVITRSLTASVGHSMVTETPEKNYRDFQAIQLLYMWICVFCTTCLYCLYQPFMRLWMGDALMFEPTVMALFCAYFFTSKMGDLCYTYRQAAGLWWQDRIRPVVEAAGNLVLNILLVQVIGVHGVLLSTIICLVTVNAVWGSRILFRHYFAGLGHGGYLLRMLFYAAAAVLCCAVTSALCGLIELEGVAELACRLAICLIVPNLMIPMLYRWLPEFSDAKALALRVLHLKTKG